MEEKYDAERLPEIVTALKNFSIIQEGFLPERWIYLGAGSLNELYTQLRQEKYQAALRVYVFNLTLPSKVKYLAHEHLRNFSPLWTEQNDWRLKHHENLFEFSAGCKVLAVVYSPV